MRPIRLATVVGSYVDVLPHMLTHYRALGVDVFHIHVHMEREGDPVRERVERIAAGHGCAVEGTSIEPWRPGTNPAIYGAIRRRHPDDWFVLADQDELHAYPDALPDLLGYCERRGYDHVEGCFLDRIARDGGFPPVRDDAPIGEQFPLGGFLSWVLMRAYPRKIVATRGRVDIGWGQHLAHSGRGLPIEECLVPVHHFKWVAGLRDRLAARARARREMNEPYGAESQGFVDYFDRNGGRIALDDPELLIADCAAADYPHWEEIREICRGI